MINGLLISLNLRQNYHLSGADARRKPWLIRVKVCEEECLDSFESDTRNWVHLRFLFKTD